MPEQCCAELPPPPCLSTALHSTALHRHDQLAKYHPVPWRRWHDVSWHQVFAFLRTEHPFSWTFKVLPPKNREFELRGPIANFEHFWEKVKPKNPFRKGFRTAWLTTGQKFPWTKLKSGSSLLTFRDPSSHICEIRLWMAKSGNLDPDKTGFFSNTMIAGFWKMGPGHFSKISNFQNIMFQPFRTSSY